jgi:hypothetical protein
VATHPDHHIRPAPSEPFRLGGTSTGSVNLPSSGANPSTLLIFTSTPQPLLRLIGNLFERAPFPRGLHFGTAWFRLATPFITTCDIGLGTLCDQLQTGRNCCVVIPYSHSFRTWANMAFFWIQQWVALPIIVEHQMGDISAGSGPPPLDIAAAGLSRDEQHSPAYRSSSGNTPFHSQLSSIPQGQAHSDTRSSFSPHFQAQEHGASPLGMGAMVGALPEYASVEPGLGNPQGQRPLPGASTSALAYQLQQNLQMPGHSPGSVPTQSPYDSGLASGQYQQTYAPNPGSHPNYAQFHHNQQRLPGQASIQPQYQSFPSHSQYMYYPPAYGPQAHFPQGYPPQSVQTQAMYGRRPSFSNAPVPMMGQGMDMSQFDALYSQGNRLAPGLVQGEQGPVGSILSGTFSTPGEYGGLNPTTTHFFEANEARNDSIHLC